MKITKPCNNCPFRREGGIRLYAARVREIAKTVAPADGGGGPFPCHKTTRAADGELRNGPHASPCAGGILFAYKQGRSSQMTRVLERLGMVPVEMFRNPDPKNEIFSSVKEMLATALDGRGSAR